jgi:Flp pilus assembly protein TadB
MIVVAVVIGLVAAGMLLVAGYQLGVSRGTRARDELRRLARTGDQQGELRVQLQGLTRALQQQEAAQRVIENDMRQYLERVAAGSSDADQIRLDLQRMLAPIVERDRADDDLRATMQELLEPLLQREQLGQDLAQVELGSGQRGELPRLLDDIARRGNFAGVILSDEAGLPLAASSGIVDLERFTGLSSLLMLLVDRLAVGGPPPLAIVVHDTANRQLLNRVFTVANQRLILTAEATGAALSPTALDPALSKVEALLAPYSVT